MGNIRRLHQVKHIFGHFYTRKYNTVSSKTLQNLHSLSIIHFSILNLSDT